MNKIPTIVQKPKVIVVDSSKEKICMQGLEFSHKDAVIGILTCFGKNIQVDQIELRTHRYGEYDASRL